jgi:hypothetical protein
MIAISRPERAVRLGATFDAEEESLFSEEVDVDVIDNPVTLLK